VTRAATAESLQLVAVAAVRRVMPPTCEAPTTAEYLRDKGLVR
jgi:hypothetical protein